ncbi:MAG: glycosyltransferase family 2 protein [Actinomycetota bacterium]|nr:glycosyltransferase family 2 protein [Actinomycetota bacterium]MDD5667752.1 glycosyltransferase family 2 protein [Actinomycetota bacterium]
MASSEKRGEYRPRVSAVIPNWHRKDDLREAIEAIKAQTYPVDEIIVVDNNSQDGTREMVKEEFPEVMFIQSPHNIVIQALNIGAKTASGDLILHQDNDGVLAPDALERLVAVMGSDPSIAVVHSRNLYYDSGEVFDPLRWFTAEEHGSDGVFDVPSFHGNGALIRRDVLEMIDYIEPEILLYQFERNISTKAIDRGFRIVYHPASTIRHKISREVRNPGHRLYITMTGGWWYLARFYPAGKALEKAATYLVFFVLYSMKHRTFRDFFRGIFDTLLGLPQVLRGRRVVSRETVRILESKPYETSLIWYGSLDTARKWLAARLKKG